MGNKTTTLAVAIATYNEEKNIGECLASVKDIADEIVVVDGGSTDKTVSIEKAYGALVIETKNPAIFHTNKQKALEACKSEWILQLDADERVTKELRAEIKNTIGMSNADIRKRSCDARKMKLFIRHQALLNNRSEIGTKKSEEIVAFFLPRRNYFLGHAMTYAGTYPDGVIRLVKRGKARFPSKSVHEQIEVDGEVAWLFNDLVHLSNPTWNRYWLGAGRYTNLLSQDIKKDHSPEFNKFITYCLWKPIIIFLALFFRYKGILDGVYGFLFCLFSAYHYPIAWGKYVGMLPTS